MFEKIFKLHENGTTIRTEVVAGITTFMTLSYIIFVQPIILSNKGCGMDKDAVFVATCVASALACFAMAFLANYPIALAPAMGHNVYFAITVCAVMDYSWEAALGAVFISGSLFVILSFFGLREKVMTIIPDSLKNAIAVGIGLLIALVGFEYAGIVVDTPGVFVGLGDMKSPEAQLAAFGTLIIAILIVMRFRGAVLVGMLATALLGWCFGAVKYYGVIDTPPSVAPTFLKFDPIGVFKQSGFLTVIFVFFFLDLFDTVGTLVGIGEQAGFMKEGRLPRARQALLSDAIGTVVGATLGTSTVTSYIESAAGVQAGGRTGLTSLTTGVFMLLALFFSPLIKMVGGGPNNLHPVIAPALIIVGSMMLQNVRKIAWDDPTEAIPAFLTLAIMPFTVNITEGIAFGFISYSLLKLFSGRIKETHWLLHVFSVLFIVRYIFLKG